MVPSSDSNNQRMAAVIITMAIRHVRDEMNRAAEWSRLDASSRQRPSGFEERDFVRCQSEQTPDEC